MGTKHGGFPITASEADKTLLGYVDTIRLKASIKKYVAAEPLALGREAAFGKFLSRLPSGTLDLSLQPGLVDESVLCVPPSCPAEQLHSYFRLLGIKIVFVVQEGRLEGMITKKSFIAHMEELHGHADHNDEKEAPLLPA